MIIVTASVFLFLIAKVMKDSPSKEINNFIGYRSKLSMKSQENWDIAQNYSMLLMRNIFYKNLIFSFPIIIIDLFLLFLKNENYFLISLCLQTIILFALFFYIFKKTEDKLKKEGN